MKTRNYWSLSQGFNKEREKNNTRCRQEVDGESMCLTRVNYVSTCVKMTSSSVFIHHEGGNRGG